MEELPPSTDPELLEDIPGILFLVFSAPWCGACPGFKATVNSLVPQFQTQALFMTVNADQNVDLANFCGVSSLPSLVSLNRGKVQAVQRGGATKTALQEWISSLLS